MPIYEYQCQECGHRAEEMRRLADPPLAVCPACGGPYKKLVSAPAFQFKGSGWYVTDYARKAEGGKEAKAGEGKESADVSDAKPAEKVEKAEKGGGEAPKAEKPAPG